MPHDKLYGRNLYSSSNYLLKGPFWDGFRRGSRWVVPFSLPFAIFSLAMAKCWIQVGLGIVALALAVYANYLALWGSK